LPRYRHRHGARFPHPDSPAGRHFCNNTHRFAPSPASPY